MEAVLDNVRGLSLLTLLTWGRALCTGAVGLAPAAGAGLGSLGAG